MRLVWTLQVFHLKWTEHVFRMFFTYFHEDLADSSIVLEFPCVTAHVIPLFESKSFYPLHLQKSPLFFIKLEPVR